MSGTSSIVAPGTTAMRVPGGTSERAAGSAALPDAPPEAAGPRFGAVGIVRGKVKEHWGKLTDDDLDVIAGKRDQLVGRIQEQYGITKDEAEQQVELFGGRITDERLPPTRQ